MNVLIDYHHLSLLRSLYILFRERFQFNVDIPSGWDWYYEGSLYSSYAPEVGTYTISPEFNNAYFHRYLPDLKPGAYEKFKDNHYDIVVCTLLENYVAWKTLVRQYNLKAKVIFQIGNNIPLWCQPTQFENIMSSSWPCYVNYPCKNKVFYHQEFDTKLFKQNVDCNRKSVGNLQHFMQMPELFYGLEKSMTDYTFHSHGAGNRDGFIPNGEHEMSDFVKNIGFLFHCKVVDEGYGHNIHNAFACGKPVITDSSHMGVDWNGWIGNTASLLFEDGKTIIDVNGKTIKEVEVAIRDMTDNYAEVSNYVLKKFQTVSDFDDEFLAIKSFLSNLV